MNKTSLLCSFFLFFTVNVFAEDTEKCIDKKLREKRQTCNHFSEKHVIIDENNQADVFLVKNTLSKDKNNSATILVLYSYTPNGRIILKKDLNTRDMPYFSVVEYQFNCSTNKQNVEQAIIYGKDNNIIKIISKSPAEDIDEGTVGQVIKNVSCYLKND